jgi:hypothetical protein
VGDGSRADDGVMVASAAPGPVSVAIDAADGVERRSSASVLRSRPLPDLALTGA